MTPVHFFGVQADPVLLLADIRVFIPDRAIGASLLVDPINERAIQYHYLGLRGWITY